MSIFGSMQTVAGDIIIPQTMVCILTQFMLMMQFSTGPFSEIGFSQGDSSLISPVVLGMDSKFIVALCYHGFMGK